MNAHVKTGSRPCIIDLPVGAYSGGPGSTGN